MDIEFLYQGSKVSFMFCTMFFQPNIVSLPRFCAEQIVE